MNIWDLLQSKITIQATKGQLNFAFVVLIATFVIISVQYFVFIKKVKQNYSLRDKPFRYYFSIYNALILIVLNEIILLWWIIQTNQEYTILGREKALIQIIGYGLFMYGWTNIVLFNLSVNIRLKRFLRVIFVGVMLFYLFAVVITTLISFQLVTTTQFLGIGYESSVLIYMSLLFSDFVALIYLASKKKNQSRFQFWLGIFLVLSLLLQIISIIFNAIPAIINQEVPPEVHAIWNFIVEPSVYIITAPMTLLLLYWVLFNPKWLENRFIEVGS